eukprot:405843_1
MYISSSVCIYVSILLGIILAILNSNNATVNEILVDSLLSRFSTGVFCMKLVNENNNVIAYGDLPSNIAQGSMLNPSQYLLCTNEIIVNNKSSVYSGFLRGTIGIGETYFRQEWTFDSTKYDLGDIITHLFWNVLNSATPFTRYAVYLSKFEWMEYLYAKRVTKDKSQDMEDVCYHYFDSRWYDKMLDKSMTYTCGLWNSSNPNQTLYDAQINKMDVLIYKLKIDNTVKNILDCGSGWGFLANRIKTHYNINVTGITISTEQHEYAEKTFGNAAIDNINTVSPYYFLKDFRDLPHKYPNGFFDRIVSVGVISHIHVKRLDEWNKILYDMLKPGGYFVMQGIVGTSAFAAGNPTWIDIRYACASQNYIYKYLFPGGCILLSDWMHESAVKAGFIVMHRDFIGQHYSKTLRKWRDNINEKKNKQFLLDIVSKKKYLSYEMYLAQSEALFRTGKLEKAQFVFYKPTKSDIHKEKFDEWMDEITLSWQ